MKCRRDLFPRSPFLDREGHISGNTIYRAFQLLRMVTGTDMSFVSRENRFFRHTTAPAYKEWCITLGEKQTFESVLLSHFALCPQLVW